MGTVPCWYSGLAGAGLSQWDTEDFLRAMKLMCDTVTVHMCPTFVQTHRVCTAPRVTLIYTMDSRPQ